MQNIYSFSQELQDKVNVYNEDFKDIFGYLKK